MPASEVNVDPALLHVFPVFRWIDYLIYMMIYFLFK